MTKAAISRRRLAVLAFGVALSGTAAAAAKPAATRFWNLTGETITHLYLAPAGTTRWSADQCRNDPDGSVDDDERLRVTGIASGRYDAKLTQKTGRVCVVKNLTIKTGAIFSIDQKALAGCAQ